MDGVRSRSKASASSSVPTISRNSFHLEASKWPKRRQADRRTDGQTEGRTHTHLRSFIHPTICSTPLTRLPLSVLANPTGQLASLWRAQAETLITSPFNTNKLVSKTLYRSINFASSSPTRCNSLASWLGVIYLSRLSLSLPPTAAALIPADCSRNGPHLSLPLARLPLACHQLYDLTLHLAESDLDSNLAFAPFLSLTLMYTVKIEPLMRERS